MRIFLSLFSSFCMSKWERLWQAVCLGVLADLDSEVKRWSRILRQHLRGRETSMLRQGCVPKCGASSSFLCSFFAMFFVWFLKIFCGDVYNGLILYRVVVFNGVYMSFLWVNRVCTWVCCSNASKPHTLWGIFQILSFCCCFCCSSRLDYHRHKITHLPLP